MDHSVNISSFCPSSRVYNIFFLSLQTRSLSLGHLVSLNVLWRNVLSFVDSTDLPMCASLSRACHQMIVRDPQSILLCRVQSVCLLCAGRYEFHWTQQQIQPDQGCSVCHSVLLHFEHTLSLSCSPTNFSQPVWSAETVGMSVGRVHSSRCT
jgi:hypothetical protein